MGTSQTKEIKNTNSPSEKVVEGLKNKVSLLQGEINEIMRLREAENEAYECEVMVFAFERAEWRKERKRLKEEMKRVKSSVMEENKEFEKCEKYNELDLFRVLEHVKVEKARRDETVEKWKQLYFAIKVELDDLIQRTHQEERVRWKTEEREMLLLEMKAKDEIIEHLQAKLASMEHQESKREREMDILRQSLRIMCHKNKATRSIHTS